MQLTINGANQLVKSKSNLLELLQELDIVTGRIAVEVNGEIVPRSKFVNCQLREGDCLEIVQAIGGG